jgi:hypothetical protein
MWWVLGTLGRLLKEEGFCAASLFFRFRLSPPVLPSLRVVAEAGTEEPAATSLDPLSDLEGFEDEHRRWWRPTKMGAVEATAFGAEETRHEARPT